MADTISVSIIITFAAELLFSLALPILALVIWKKREGTELRPAWIGAAAYFVFGMVLEQKGEYGDASGRYTYMNAYKDLKCIVELLESDR